MKQAKDSTLNYEAEVFVRVHVLDRGKRVGHTQLRMAMPLDSSKGLRAAVESAGKRAQTAYVISQRSPAAWWRVICDEVPCAGKRVHVASAVWWAYGQRGRRLSEAENKAWAEFRRKHCGTFGSFEVDQVQPEELEQTLQRIGWRYPDGKDQRIKRTLLLRIVRLLLEQASASDFKPGRKKRGFSG